MAKAYTEGIGVEKDEKKAAEWREKSREKKNRVFTITAFKSPAQLQPTTSFSMI